MQFIHMFNFKEEKKALLETARSSWVHPALCATSHMLWIMGLGRQRTGLVILSQTEFEGKDAATISV